MPAEGEHPAGRRRRSRRATGASMLVLACLPTLGCRGVVPPTDPGLAGYVLSYDTPVDSMLQARLEAIDARARTMVGIPAERTDVGLLDLAYLRLAMIHPDSIRYAASVAKIGILLAYFQLHPEAATRMDPGTRHELGLMIKASSNTIAAKHSHALGLARIQEVLDSYGFYDAAHGGGIWVGRHYGEGGERIGDPIADHSHAATVRQLLRYYLLLVQGRLVSPEASRAMLQIFASPDIAADSIKFVKGLEGRRLEILRKWGSWEDWLHDTAIIGGADRHYILVALTHDPRGDDYLVALAAAVDDLMISEADRLGRGPALRP